MTVTLVFGITLVIFVLVIAGMAVGVMMGRQSIRGSCGGLGGQTTGEDGQSACSMCSQPSATCRELAERGDGDEASSSPLESAAKEAIDACKSN